MLPGLGLGQVLDGQNRVGDGQLVVEREARNRCAAFVGDQLEMVGFAANDAAQRDECVELIALGQRLQRAGDFKRAGHGHVRDVFGFDPEHGELAQAGLRQRAGHAFVEARLHHGDVELSAVKLVRPGFFYTKHGFLLLRLCAQPGGT